MRILVLGSKGMLGQTVVKYLSNKGHDVRGLNRSEFDALKQPLELVVDLKKFDYVINCIGLLNHENNIRQLIWTNSLLPHVLDALSKEYNFKLIHISTDCYLDNTPYGHSKWLGELRNSDNLTLRTSIIGKDKYKQGTGLFNWFVSQKSVNGYLNHIWYGVTTLELAKAIEKCIENDLKGIIEVTNGEGISKFNLLELIRDEYKLDIEIIPAIIGEGQNKVLHKDYDFNIPSYKDMIREMREFDED